MDERVAKLLAAEYAPQRSDEWLRLREGMLTASDAATALGLNPYERPKDLLMKKCGLKQFNGNAATMHGNKYEDEARDIYCLKYNEVAHEIGLRPHPEHQWLGGSPDGITESGKLLEIKCPLRREIKEEVPVYYMPQLQLLMEILDLDQCDFIQYKPAEMTWPGPSEFVVVHVLRDRQWFRDALPVFRAFWDTVIESRKNGLRLPPTRARTKKVALDVAPEKCEIEDDDESPEGVFE
jgi:putative phage-type endonuclease